MFSKMAQHPVHYVFGCITHAPLVFQAWALEDFGYKMRWLVLYVLGMSLAVCSTIGISAGVFVGVCVISIIGFMALPSFMGSKGGGSFLLRFSNAYANAVLAWHGFFVSFYLFMMLFATMMLMLDEAWTKHSAAIFMGAIAVLYIGFTMQMAASTTKGVGQLAVPAASSIAGMGMYALTVWSLAGF